VTHLRDPGGTPIGERIREILLSPEHDAMEPETETLLYLAARCQLVRERIAPALDAGVSVVCERFVYSTAAYQGARGDLRSETIWKIWRLISPGIEPDLVILLDLDPEIGLSRLRRAQDRMESLGLDFHRRVHRGFREMARSLPDLVEVIPAEGTADEVEKRVRDTITRRLLGS
jgi:dTMP kinase